MTCVLKFFLDNHFLYDNKNAGRQVVKGNMKVEQL